MTFDRECAHGMPSPASCTECMEDGPVAAPEVATPPRAIAIFLARYDGHCFECDLPIVGGAHRIARLENDRLVHEHCAPGERSTLF